MSSSSTAGANTPTYSGPPLGHPGGPGGPGSGAGPSLGPGGGGGGGPTPPPAQPGGFPIGQNKSSTSANVV